LGEEDCGDERGMGIGNAIAVKPAATAMLRSQRFGSRPAKAAIVPE